MGRGHKCDPSVMSHFILADCNNFYVSCERLLNPRLENKPVLVLSNNDGCVIARSEEVKALGIKMGEPFFKIESFCKRSKIFIYSSNYELYGDISRRVMNVLGSLAPEMQIYSIDETFLKYPSYIDQEELCLIAHHLRKIVKRWVGIPISLGIGPTKTLAKVANNLAKHYKKTVFDLSSKNLREELFKKYPIGEVWGIGFNLKARLNSMGIYTVYDFISSDIAFIRKKMGVVGERMYLELQGFSCLTLEERASKKSITSSRSFGHFLTEESEIAEALSTYAARACVKLRKQNCFVKAIYVFLETQQVNLHELHRLQFNSTKAFDLPTNDTSQVIALAKKCLKSIYKPHQAYKKCGIILLDLCEEKDIVPDLFLKPVNEKRKTLMHTVDELNKKFGKDKIFFGAMGTNPHWQMKRNFKSCHNTTSWDALPQVSAHSSIA